MLPVNLEPVFKKCAKVAGVKSVTMIPLNDLTKITGYVRGGCSPIGMKKNFRTFIHESAILEENIYFSGGKIGLQIHMNSQDLISSMNIEIADLIQ